jgi:hypothetical protein
MPRLKAVYMPRNGGFSSSCPEITRAPPGIRRGLKTCAETVLFSAGSGLPTMNEEQLHRIAGNVDFQCSAERENRAPAACPECGV